MRIAKVALVRRAEVDLRLVERVLDFVRKDACREAGDDLVGFVRVRRAEDVVVYQRVVAEERELLGICWGA